MPGLSSADHSVSPPIITIPRQYNAAHDLIERNLAAGRAAKIAYIDDAGRYTYGELAQRVDRAANALTGLGLEMEDRIMLAHLDTIDFPSVFLGAIKAGIVPIAANTLLTTADYKFMLEDSRARALVVSEALLPDFAPILGSFPRSSTSSSPARTRTVISCFRNWERMPPRASKPRRPPATTCASGSTPPAPPARPRVQSMSTRA